MEKDRLSTCSMWQLTHDPATINVYILVQATLQSMWELLLFSDTKLGAVD